MGTCRLLAVLLLVSGILFVLGSQIERHSETSVEAKASTVEKNHDVTAVNGPGSSEHPGAETRRRNADVGPGADKPTLQADNNARTSNSAETRPEASTSATSERAATPAAGETSKQVASATPESSAQHRAELHKEASCSASIQKRPGSSSLRCLLRCYSPVRSGCVQAAQCSSRSLPSAWYSPDSTSARCSTRLMNQTPG